MKRLIHSSTILCVDDESGALRIRKLLLESAGYTVLPAGDAASALRTFESHSINLVISDHLLPGLTGAALTQEMKLTKPFVPVMLLSGLTEQPAGAEHADGFINKNDGPVVFLEQVADLLRSSRITHGNYFAEIRCDKRSQPNIWHYTIQRLRSREIVSWHQEPTRNAAIRAARGWMRSLSTRHLNHTPREKP